MSPQGSLSIERMCQLAPVSRAGIYRSLHQTQPLEEEMAVRAEISRSHWPIGVGMTIDGSPRNCGGGGYW
jgi:hypothetical protein